MTKADLTPYVEALTSKKNELQDYVKQQLGQINYPVPTQMSQQPSATRPFYLPVLSIGAGLVLLAIGVGTKTHAVTIGGGVVAAAGLYVWNKNRNRGASPVPPSTDYTQLTNLLINALKNIHIFASDEWSQFLDDQKNKLKGLIEMSDFDTETKSQLIQLTTRRSVIQYSMMDVLAELSAVEKKQSTEAYKQYVADFLVKYERIIEEAHQEQKQRYETIASLVN